MLAFPFRLSLVTFVAALKYSTFVFLFEGSATYELTDHHQIHLNGGEFSYMPAGMFHHALDNQNATCRMVWVVLSSKVPDNAEPRLFTSAEHADFMHRLAHFGPCTRKFGAESIATTFGILKKTVRALTEDDHSPLQAAKLRSCLLELLLHGIERFEDTEARTPDDYIRTTIDHMQQHLSEPVTMTDFADYLGLSESRFYAMFKEEMGQTPNDYLTRLRIARAKELIGSTDDSLKTIAETSGLSTSQYLRRVFRKYTGHRPGEYRNSG